MESSFTGSGGLLASYDLPGKECHRMQSTTIKRTIFALSLAILLPLAACGHDNNTPTSPTQPGPTVTTTPMPEPSPTPTPTPAPTPTPQPPSDQPTVTLTGTVANLDRSGPGDLDISFRIDDFTIVRAKNGTPVMSGGQTFNTDAVRNGQQVKATGTRSNGFLDATSIEIIAQAP
jgi:hypothetical protein